MEGEPLKLGEGQRASDNKQVLDWGPRSVSILSPRARGGYQGGHAPSNLPQLWAVHLCRPPQPRVPPGGGHLVGEALRTAGMVFY